MSCTRNDIRLWTVNGVLLARAELTITGNFRLLCCAVSEVRGIKESGGKERSYSYCACLSLYVVMLDLFNC